MGQNRCDRDRGLQSSKTPGVVDTAADPQVLEPDVAREPELPLEERGPVLVLEVLAVAVLERGRRSPEPLERLSEVECRRIAAWDASLPTYTATEENESV